MEEMNKMNETTVVENETSVEAVPEENVQMIENEETSGFDPKVVIGLALVGGAAVIGGIKHLKNKKKDNASEKKPKTKKKIHLRTPWTVTEEIDEAQEGSEEKPIEETSEEEN